MPQTFGSLLIVQGAEFLEADKQLGVQPSPSVTEQKEIISAYQTELQQRTMELGMAPSDDTSTVEVIDIPFSMLLPCRISIYNLDYMSHFSAG